jgi:hypothetical protein
MPTVEATIRIGVPPMAVHEVLMDAEKAPLWTAGLERLELVSGEIGQPGCVGRAHYVEGGRRYEMSDVLEEITPGRWYASRVSGGGITARVETRLEPVGEGETQMTLRWSGRGTNPVTFVMLSLMRRRIRERMEADLRSLRGLAEGG